VTHDVLARNTILMGSGLGEGIAKAHIRMGKPAGSMELSDQKVGPCERL